MSSEESAEAAVSDLAAFFSPPGRLNYDTHALRECEDRITVISFYLAEKRRTLEFQRQQRLHDHRPQIRNGHVWDNLR